MENSDLLRALRDETEPDCQVLRSLVRNPANSNTISILGEALYVSMSRGFLTSLQTLLEAGVSPNTKSEHSEETPLHVCSCYKQGAEMLQELLKHGADVDAVGDFARTPLFYASYHACVANMQVLLKNGATVNAGDSNGHTPLFFAIVSTDCSTVQVLLRAGADVNFHSVYGSAPLHYAVSRELPEVVRLLLRHKADANIKDSSGETPLHRSASVKNHTIELIRDLHKCGAEVNVLNNSGHSPLYFAIDFHNVEATQELLRSGASFDIVECFEALKNSAFSRESPHEITAISQELMRYVFIKNPDSLENIRQQLMQKRVVRVLCRLSSRECNLKNFKYACLSEVEMLSKMSCDCGESSIWGSINNCEDCICETHQAILKFLFSERKTNFGDAFFYRLSKEFLLKVTLNLMLYLEFKESKKRFILPWPCRKGIERYVSFEDAVLFLQCKQSEIVSFDFREFLAFMEEESLAEVSSEIPRPSLLP